MMLKYLVGLLVLLFVASYRLFTGPSSVRKIRS